MKPDFIIGIDPDCEKSGVACISTSDMKIVLSNMTFPALVEYFRYLASLVENGEIHEHKVAIVIEAGWLNKSHYHGKSGDSRRLSAAKGNSVGRNHETGRKLVEMAKHYGLNVIEQRPLRKCWKGPDGKITHEEIKQFIPNWPSRSNQETRDAALLLWNYAGFPIRIKVGK